MMEKASSCQVLATIIFIILCQLGDATFTLKVHFKSYTNPSHRDYDHNLCDIKVYFLSKHHCDNRFIFCLDKFRNNNNLGEADCSYRRSRTGEYRNDDGIAFGTSMRGVTNPMIIQSSNWQDLHLKVRVDDVDDASGDDFVDSFFYKWSATPPVNGKIPSAFRILLRGTRSSSKTSLTVEFSVWCNQNYYGRNCNTYCRPRNDAAGHYRCTSSGQKVCLTGWEDTSSSCRRRANDCESHPCQNGGTCVDGYRRFTCRCKPGFAGTRCESDVDECRSSPCRNNGRCVNGKARFDCVCPDSHPVYLSRTCSIHSCRTYKCFNGGTCYGARRCQCMSNFHGSRCQYDVNECYSSPCNNNGTCVNTYGGFNCTCPDSHPASLSPTCEVHACLNHNPCLNGGTCSGAGQCQCAPNYTGTRCELHECGQTNMTCENGGLCKGSLCYCPAGTRGKYCEEKLVEESVAVPWLTLIVPIIVGVLILLLIIMLVTCLCKTCQKRKVHGTSTSRIDVTSTQHKDNGMELSTVTENVYDNLGLFRRQQPDKGGSVVSKSNGDHVRPGN